MKHLLFVLTCFYLAGVMIRLGLAHNGIEWDASTRITDMALTAGAWLGFLLLIFNVCTDDTQD